MSGTRAARRLVLVDRDGVINHDSDDYVKSVDEWRPIPGSLEAIARLSAAGFEVAVVSNQSGLARGLFDRAALDEIHAELRRRVEQAGGRIAGIFVCPHAPDAGCDCRKPEVGLLRQVEDALGLAVAGAPLVGDKASDLELARRGGCAPFLVRTGKGSATERAGAGLEGATVCDDLSSVATLLCAGSEPAGPPDPAR